MLSIPEEVKQRKQKADQVVIIDGSSGEEKMDELVGNYRLKNLEQNSMLNKEEIKAKVKAKVMGNIIGMKKKVSILKRGQM